MLIADDQPAEKWFAELIAHTALAGACGLWTRREPLAAPGLTRIAERERGLAASLMEQNSGAQNRITLVLGAFITSAGPGGHSRADVKGNGG